MGENEERPNIDIAHEAVINFPTPPILPDTFEGTLWLTVRTIRRGDPRYGAHLGKGSFLIHVLDAPIASGNEGASLSLAINGAGEAFVQTRADRHHAFQQGWNRRQMGQHVELGPGDSFYGRNIQFALTTQSAEAVSFVCAQVGNLDDQCSGRFCPTPPP
jgi:hypothetical protein